MDRDEVLKAIEESSKSVGEYENNNSTNGLILGELIGFIISILMIIVESFLGSKIDYGKVAIIFSIITVSFIYEGIKNKSQKLIIGGSASGLCFALSLILYIGALM